MNYLTHTIGGMYMTSSLKQALSQVQAPKVAISKLQGQTYQAQRVAVAPVKQSNVLNSLMGMAQAGTQAYGAYVAKREEQGIQRKNEILLKNMRPEEIKKMREDGTLLYQDDPYAMRALERELGRQEAYNVDAIVANKIRAGDFKSRQDMEDFRASLYEQSMSTMAEAYGINPTSTYFREGLQSDIVERNMAVYNTQAVKTDQAERNKARLVIEGNIQAIVNSGKNSGYGTMEYLKKAREEGLIRSDEEMEVYLNKTAKELAQRPDGVEALKEMANSKVTLWGEETTYAEAIGTEAMNLLILNAHEKQFQNDWENQEQFIRGLHFITSADLTTPEGIASAKDKVSSMWKQLHQLDQNSPLVTQQKQQLLQAELQLQDNMKRAVEAKKSSMKGNMQLAYRIKYLNEVFNKRINGENISTAYDAQIEDEMTGKWTDSDLSMFAEWKIQEIRGDTTLTPEQQDLKLLAYLKADDNKSKGFREKFNTLVQDASQEWTASVLASKYGQPLPENPRLNELTRFYQLDPSTIQQLYPENAELIMKLDLLSKAGFNQEMLAKAEAQQQGMTEQMRFQLRNDWNTVKNNSKYSELASIPATLDNQAFEVYQAYAAFSGNTSAAAQYTAQYMQSNYEPLTIDDNQIGMVSKKSLMINPSNPNSYEQGKQLIQKVLKDNNLGSDTLITNTFDGRIQFMNPTGGVYVFSTEDLRKIQEAMTVEEREQALEDVQSGKSKQTYKLQSNRFFY
ncbi:internal virion protein C [Vibrio phage ICP3_2008_A]|uniref:Internal virion protein C n=1 Tax=Vibrio phage ICP3_2008_A TaxID=979537 RepID=F1D0I3_9CAUD|nr:internal virion protein C [Vibrio phage ICP3_2008_A]